MLRGLSIHAGLSTHLLIDGNREDRDYYARRLLVFADCVVIEANTGLDGLEFCRDYSVDCVLELDLPDISGFEVLVKLVPRAQQPDIAVIVLTLLRNDYLLALALKNGAQAALYNNMASGDILHHTVLKALPRCNRIGNEPRASIGLMTNCERE
jgi:DNA-binding NarL/FixJ family response regulator